MNESAVIPDVDCSNSTAYVDLYNDDFNRPEFLKELSTSFEKLRIVGIAEKVSDNQTIEIAK